MNNKELIVYKKDLVLSDVYKEIRKIQIDEVIKNINKYEPVEIKGMFKLINSTDKWYDEFLALKDGKS